MITRAKTNTLIFDQNGVQGKRIGLHLGCEYVRLELAPGKIIAKHVLDVPVVFYVLEGSGTVLLDGEQIIANHGDMLFVQAGANRGWENTSDHELTILVIKYLDSR